MSTLLIAITQLLKVVVIVVPLLIAVAYVTLAERKIMASMQLRKGPNVVGFAGLLQPLADGLKLFAKETILPTHANIVIFIIAPILSLILALISLKKKKLVWFSVYYCLSVLTKWQPIVIFPFLFIYISEFSGERLSNLSIRNLLASLKSINTKNHCPFALLL